MLLYYHSLVDSWLIIWRVLLVSYKLFGTAKGTCWNNRAVLYVTDAQLTSTKLKFDECLTDASYPFGPKVFRG